MVNYACKYCNKISSNKKEIENCEAQGLIGPDMEPGLLFSHKKVGDSFLIFYNELKPEGHERQYFVEEFLSKELRVIKLQAGVLNAKKFNEWLKLYSVATNKDVNDLTKKINEDFLGAGGIKVYMERFGTEKLHNNFYLKNYFLKIKQKPF